MRTRNFHLSLFVTYLAVLIWSAINPKDYFTWFLEVFPALFGLLILLLTYHRFPLTRLAYILILLHCCVLFVGGHYTYAEVPLFDWFREVFHQSRNNYDKVGHFVQGMVPAIIAREIYVRKKVIAGSGWLNFLVVATCVTISVLYEFLEWAVAVFTGESAEAFLGTQGYVWDTQSDILFATIGAIIGLMVFSRTHNKQMAGMRVVND